MIVTVFGIRDSKGKAFLQPFFSNSSGAAIRAFGDEVSNRSSPIGKHPHDYVLYELASFDDLSGEFISVNPIKLLSTGADFSPMPGVVAEEVANHGS